MRNMSFALTTQQVRARTKTVTRRCGWTWLTPGTLLQPVVKSQGLKKGETVERIGGPIRVTKVGRERLLMMIANPTYGRREVKREGFHDFTRHRFVEMFSKSHGCDVDTVVTRIEFEYVDEAYEDNVGCVGRS